ncbi:MAG TPA: alpha/beta hydrolase [Steroidobacteraceae bacterium]|nr:alpha/beta hydrolase [Steroidobacteraceae bacterium]
MKVRTLSRIAGIVVVCLSSAVNRTVPARESVVPSTPVTPTGAVTLTSSSIPFSSFASPEALAQFMHDIAAAAQAPALNSSIEVSRRYYDAINSDRVERLKRLFAVTIESESIAGVPTDVVRPAQGVSASNRHRVLINLHGGAFLWGAHSGGLVESIPIASRGGLTVISVDYRQGPEHTFPAASVDVATVYAALLKRYRPQNIGIYGTSAGGILAAQSIAWIAAHGLPRPGAVATLCGSALELQGDSAFVGPMLTGQAPAAKPLLLAELPYFKGANSQDPLVFPGVSNIVLTGFPPTLLVTGTRDFTMSSVVRTHALLVQAGVDAELHVYEGMWHAFLVDPELPESRSAYDLIARFFNRHLGG